jgi:hypothetical protein
MNKLTILLFSTLISFNSYGEWKYVIEGDSSHNTFYIDTDTIKEHKGYVYWWVLGNYLKPNYDGTMSGKVYEQGECGVSRHKTLTYIWYKQPMGEGSGKIQKSIDTDWKYPPPESVGEILLKYACNYVN